MRSSFLQSLLHTARQAQIAALAATSFAAVGGPTADGARLADAVAQSNAAVEHLKRVGTEQAARDVMDDPAWQANGMAVVLVDHSGRVLASSLNPNVVGKNTADLKDPSGKLWVREAIGLSAARREGWVDYQFIDVQTRRRVDRVMRVKPWPTGNGFVGVALNRP